MTKRTLLFSSVVIVLIACQKRPTNNAPNDSAGVLAASEQYRKAWIDGDTAGALRRITNDIRIYISGVPDVIGMEAARRLFLDEMATYRVSSLELHHQEMNVSGDYAIDIGTYDEVQLPKTGAPIHGRGRFMTIWRRDGGEWRIARYMLNDLPK